MEPHLEAFMMMEDIRFEKSGQFTLTGVLGDMVYSKVWPLQLAKTCFHVRVRNVEGAPKHALVVSRLDTDVPMANLGGQATKGDGDVNIFNYFLAGLSFPTPGSYVARFSLSEGGKTLFRADYAFRLLSPNPQELYVECPQCHIKYGSGIVARDASQFVDTTSECPQCKKGNVVNAQTAIHLANPK